MFQQDEYFILKNRDNVVCVTNDEQIFWATDIRLAYRFSSKDEAYVYSRTHFIALAQIEGFPHVERMIILYITE